MGASSAGEEGGVISHSVGLQCPHRHAGSHFYLLLSILGTHFQRSRRARAGLSGVLAVASHFIYPGGHQSCGWTEQGRGHVRPSPYWALCRH